MPTNSSISLPDRIAKCALHHYHYVLPSNNGGKPQQGREWTVYAAIVAVRSDDDGNIFHDIDQKKSGGDAAMWVVSCATGSKCTSVNSIVSTFPTVGNADGKDSDAAIIQSYNGMVLKDSHAEVLSRRGLMTVLWNEIEVALEHLNEKNATDTASASKVECAKRLLEVLPHRNKLGMIQFGLRKDITLHMYISDSPCGDATIYEIKKIRDPAKQDEDLVCSRCNEEGFDTEMNFTGAKLILTGNEAVDSDLSTKQDAGNDKKYSLSEIITVTSHGNSKDDSTRNNSTIKLGREHIQQLGALRLKSSRSNIPSHLRSTSMSCADKFVRWGLLGLQGSLLMAFIPQPICLTSICVSNDSRALGGSQSVALTRALKDRISIALEILRSQNKCLIVTPPDVAIVDEIYESSKSECENRHLMREYNDGKRNEQDDAPEKHILHANKKLKIGNDSGEKFVQPFKADKKLKKESPSGMCINWHQLQSTDSKSKAKNVEVTVGATGLKRGKKPKHPQDVINSSSRLCRYSFINRCKKCYELLARLIRSSENDFKIGDLVSYLQYKKELSQMGIVGDLEYIFNRDENGCSGPLDGWVRSGYDNDFNAF